LLLPPKGWTGEAYYQVSGQWHRQNYTIDSNNLKKGKPSISLLGLSYGRKLYDGSDHSQAQVNPIASASMEIPPVGTYSKAYLDC
jgi:hypothetical protein